MARAMRRLIEKSRLQNLSFVVTFWFLAIALLVPGCGTGNKEQADEEDTDEQELYREAQASIRSANYSTAVKRLELLESHFPFGSYAEQAKLDTIFSYFMQSDFESAAAAAESFIEAHPQHQNVDYAYYLKGLSSYESNRGFFDRLLGAPEYMRDVTNARRSFGEFKEFLERFPNSLYAKDAQLRMVHLRNIIARAEINIASFYLTRDAHVAALKRATAVVEEFPKADVVPDALAIMVEANHKLGLEDAADDSLRILTLNFPTYRGFNAEGDLILDYAGNYRDRSFLSMVSFGLLGKNNVPPPLRPKAALD